MLVRIATVLPSRAAHRFKRLLQGSHVLLSSFPSAGKDLTLLDREEFDVALVPRHLLGDRAEPIISRLRNLPDRPEIVALTREEAAADRALLLSAGCFAVLHEMLPDEVLAAALQALVQRRRETMQGRFLQGAAADTASLKDFITESPVMKRFMSVVQKLVHADSSLLITGETGVGKERLARAIHAASPRGGGPFIAVNCGAMPETLLESELFGHEKGAFTGATRSRRGYFELADRGTIFLDEIGDLPAHLQVKLMRVIQDRAIQRLGGESLLAVDVRVMSATNRNLETEMEQGRFRADLYYRLGVVALTIPPLRERREDIRPLVNSYLEHFRRVVGREVTGIHPDAREALERYSWPGNVRELINTLERAVLLSAGPEISLEDLPVRISRYMAAEARSPGREEPPAVRLPVGTLGPELLARPLGEARREVVEALERTYLTALLRENRGRIADTASRAGIKERTLFGLMKRHRLRKEDYKRR